MKKAVTKISATDILLTGLVGGLIYYALNLVFFFPAEQFSLMTSSFLKINLFVYSFCVWLVGFTLLSAVLYLITLPLGGDATRRGRFILRRFIVYFILALAILTGHALWMSYSRMSPVLPAYVRTAELRSAVLIGVVIAFLGALILSFVDGLAARRSRGRPVSLIAFFLICLLYVVVVNLPADYARLGRIEDVAPASPPRTVILGVEAGSWNVILPFIERGDLPAFKRMMDEGSYGYLDCYGPRLSASSWSTIATGQRSEDHGVHEFASLSSDWKAAPLWSIMSAAGRTSGIVNWVCTWPPFEVEGAFISGVFSPRSGNAHFSDEYVSYMEPTDAILGRWEYEVPANAGAWVEQAGQEMTQLETIDEEVISGVAPDLVTYNYYSTDALQHVFWKDMEPDLFTEGDWEGTLPDEDFAEAIRDCWIRADGLLGSLLERYGDDAYYLVVSDHGARPVNRRQVVFDMTGLLEGMGYLKRQSGEVDHAGSVCYLAGDGPQHFMFDIKINPGEYTEGKEVDENHYREVRAGITRDLRAARLKGSGKRLFRDFMFAEGPAGEDKPDVRVIASTAILKMPDRDEIVVAGGEEIPVTDLISFHVWSGRHRARGIVVARGPEIKHRYTGAWTIDDAYTRIFRYISGRYSLVDKLRSPLKRLHLIDEATTLDIAPTVLYLSGLPVAEDMDGRVLNELITGDFRKANPIETTDTYGIGEVLSVESRPAEEARMKERLRALGDIH
ncbi:MAG: alkaline phosphatase family protein [bacterium]|jgi:predicted AlkP superfamily phosphohydrolase/phosphomutase